ncbi:hypothetical protein VTL71DRAFT_6788 [Oculimacula yallundae]|uniref:Uncharacterized protein n=1 Tax=Oculimacula yallundae TaxID=86028 RepID=A0ABR4BYW7_9HELO
MSSNSRNLSRNCPMLGDLDTSQPASYLQGEHLSWAQTAAWSQLTIKAPISTPRPKALSWAQVASRSHLPQGTISTTISVSKSNGTPQDMFPRTNPKGPQLQTHKAVGDINHETGRYHHTPSAYVARGPSSNNRVTAEHEHKTNIRSDGPKDSEAYTAIRNLPVALKENEDIGGSSGPVGKLWNGIQYERSTAKYPWVKRNRSAAERREATKRNNAARPVEFIEACETLRENPRDPRALAILVKHNPRYRGQTIEKGVGVVKINPRTDKMVDRPHIHHKISNVQGPQGCLIQIADAGSTENNGNFGRDVFEAGRGGISFDTYRDLQEVEAATEGVDVMTKSLQAVYMDLQCMEM